MHTISRAERAGYFEIWPREAVFLGVSDPISGQNLREEPIVTAAFDWLIEHADDAKWSVRMMRGLDDECRPLVVVLQERDARHRALIREIGAALDAGDCQTAMRLVKRFKQETGQ